MKSAGLIVSTLILAASPVFALPALQLYIDGAIYDDETETWVMTDNSSFDLYVVGCPGGSDSGMSTANRELGDTYLIVTTDSGDDPAGSVRIDGQDYPADQWAFGSPSMNPAFPPHGIFPAWYFVVEIGGFSNLGGIGSALPDSEGRFFNPSQGYDDESDSRGEIKSLAVEVSGEITNLHFDVVSIDDGRRGCFAPFSRDAGYYDETRYPPTAVDETPLQLPESLVILQAYPNPFNAETIIEFTLSKDIAVKLEMFDSRGRYVTTLTDSSYEAGIHSVRWNGTAHSGERVASGVYMIKLTTPESVVKSNIVLLK